MVHHSVDAIGDCVGLFCCALIIFWGISSSPPPFRDGGNAMVLRISAYHLLRSFTCLLVFSTVYTYYRHNSMPSLLVHTVCQLPSSLSNLLSCCRWSSSSLLFFSFHHRHHHHRESAIAVITHTRPYSAAATRRERAASRSTEHSICKLPAIEPP